MGDENAWLSLHLFLHEVGAYDLLLVETVGPALRALEQEGWIDRFFFLRYWEGGPHLRVRMLGQRPGWRAAAEAEIRRVFAAFVERHSHSKAAEPKGMERPGPVAESGPFLYENHTVHEIAYEPEYERYGGPAAMAVTEELFHVSSQCALSLLPMLLQSPEKRLGLALELMFLGSRCFPGLTNDVGASLARQAGFFARLQGEGDLLLQQAVELQARHGPRLGARLSALRQEIQTGRLTGLYQRWATSLAKTHAALQQLEQEGRLLPAQVREAGLTPTSGGQPSTLSTIGMSHLHMLNNRLGVTLRMESILAHLLRRLIEDGRVEA